MFFAKGISLIVLATSALAATVVVKVPTTDIIPSPDAINIFTTCNDLNLSGFCLGWSSTVLPTGCGNFVGTGQDDQVTSASSPAGIACTLFADPGCTGRSQLVVGTINDLRTVGFDDTATTFNCRSA